MAIHHGWQAGAVREPPGIGVRAPDGKRLFDILLALALLLPLSAVMLAVAGLLLLMQGRPVLYLSKRMGASGQSFRLLKFRTMVPVAEDGGATGGHKSWRITRLGHLLRRSRIDELPQLFNILRGDMSFVGPRPPLREYVERFPHRYALVLRMRPGVTGLATLVCHAHEDRILARCLTQAATQAAYDRLPAAQAAAGDGLSAAPVAGAGPVDHRQYPGHGHPPGVAVLAAKGSAG